MHPLNTLPDARPAWQNRRPFSIMTMAKQQTTGLSDLNRHFSKSCPAATSHNYHKLAFSRITALMQGFNDVVHTNVRFVGHAFPFESGKVYFLFD